jgi:hypothetical protein
MADAPDSADDLELMPRVVRDKLDRIRIKVHLRDWQKMSLQERILLRDLPCADDAEAQRYRTEVERLVVRITGRPPEPLLGRER